MKVLVIGGTGFIGPSIVRCLHSLGHDVTIFHRGENECDFPPSVRHIHGDHANLPKYRAEFRRLHPDVAILVYCDTQAHAESVRDALKGIARRLVALSSVDVYRAYDVVMRRLPGPPEAVPLSENAPLRTDLFPDSEYPDGDKILVERVVFGEPMLPGTVLRLAGVYGPGDPQHRIFPYLKRMDDRRTLILLDEGTASWRFSRLYVENAAAGITLAATDESATGRVYNVAETNPYTEMEWVRAIGRAISWSGEVVTLPRDKMPSVRVPTFNTDQSLVVDTRRIRQELGYVEPVGRDDALRATVAWERSNPPTFVDPARFDYAAEDAAVTSN